MDSKMRKFSFVSCFRCILIETINAFTTLKGATKESTKESISLLAIRQKSDSGTIGDCGLSVIPIMDAPLFFAYVFMFCGYIIAHIAASF